MITKDWLNGKNSLSSRYLIMLGWCSFEKTSTSFIANSFSLADKSVRFICFRTTLVLSVFFLYRMATPNEPFFLEKNRKKAFYSKNDCYQVNFTLTNHHYFLIITQFGLHCGQVIYRSILDSIQCSLLFQRTSIRVSNRCGTEYTYFSCKKWYCVCFPHCLVWLAILNFNYSFKHN